MKNILCVLAEYYMNEFEHGLGVNEIAEKDFGLAFTELYSEDDTEIHDMQVSLDMNKLAITFAVDNEIFHTWYFKDEQEVAETIDSYDFQSWYGETIRLYEDITGIELH